MSRKKIKVRKIVKCVFCDKEHRKGLAYYRDEVYSCNKKHWRKWRQEKTNGKQTKT